MLITFTVTDQKIKHDLGKKSLVAGSSGVVQAKFIFDDSWEGLDKVVVFTNTNSTCGDIKPIVYDGEAINIPEQALKAGKLYCSVVGFGAEDTRKTTMKWDIQQAITVQNCGAMGCTDLLRGIAQGGVKPGDVATDEEVKEMYEEVFGDTGPVATDEEVEEVLDDVFGDNPPPNSGSENAETGNGTGTENERPQRPGESEPEEDDGIATDEEVGEMLDDIFG